MRILRREEMKQKIFAASDIHGYYTELMKALAAAGFDKENENHIFVSCGDLFDRGSENIKVYDFVKSLKRKILIKGNHEDMLSRILKEGNITHTDISNGTDITVAEFFGEDSIDSQGNFETAAHAEKIGEMTAFLDSMINYYETEQYVFTHGWLPIVFDGRYPQINPSWKNVPDSEWEEEVHLLEWQQLYDAKALLEGKIIVCGHRPARLGNMFDDCREPDCSEPFYGKGMIAIDAGTMRSGRVNVLVVEESKN